jgi:hypothetical protein
MSTKAELQAVLTAANVSFSKKDNKATLEAAIAALSAPVRKQRVSTKQILRDMFANVGQRILVEEVVAHITAQANVAPATIVTMIGDLKNPKYAAGPTINIVREGNAYVRGED